MLRNEPRIPPPRNSNSATHARGPTTYNAYVRRSLVRDVQYIIYIYIRTGVTQYFNKVRAATRFVTNRLNRNERETRESQREGDAKREREREGKNSLRRHRRVVMYGQSAALMHRMRVYRVLL